MTVMHMIFRSLLADLLEKIAFEVARANPPGPPNDLRALIGVTYTPGILNGSWQGRMLVPIKAAYIVTPHRQASFGEGNPGWFAVCHAGVNILVYTSTSYINNRDWTLLSWCPWTGTTRVAPYVLNTMQIWQ